MTLHRAGTDARHVPTWRDSAMLAFAAPVLPVLKALRRSRAPSLKVVVYHDVVPAAVPAFRDQLSFLIDNYRLISPEAYRAGAFDSADGRPGVLVTFDDGFRSNRIIAESVLAPLGIKAIFFVPGALLALRSKEERLRFIRHRLIRRGTLASLPAGADLMTLDQLRELLREGHTIGAHGWGHLPLVDLKSDEELVAEVNRPGDELSRELGVAIDWFAYPFGGDAYVDERAYAFIRNRYRFCCTSVRGSNYPSSSPLAVLRETVAPSTPIRVLELMMEDGLSPMYHRNARRVRRMAGAPR